MVNLPDEALMKFADDALDEAEHNRIASLVAADPELQRRLQPFLLTRHGLRDLFDEALTSQIPDRLVNTVLTAPIGGSARHPAVRQSEPFFARLRQAFFPELPAFAGAFALAACVTGIAGLGYVAGQVTRTSGAVGPQIATVGGEAIAAGALKSALESTLSEQTFESGLVRVKIQMSFQDTSGRFCRKYAVAEAGGADVGGFACRAADGQWTIAYHAPVAPTWAIAARGVDGGDTFTPSTEGSKSPLDAAIEGVNAGGVLDVTEEESLIADGWKTLPPQQR